MKNLKNRHVICIIAAIICIMGSLIEYICTKKPPYLVNMQMSIAMSTIIIFCLICKPAGDWLEKPVHEPYNPNSLPRKSTKEQVKQLLRKFAPTYDKDYAMKVFWWDKKQLWIVLYNNGCLFCSEDDCKTLISINNKFTDFELQEVIHYFDSIIMKKLVK